MKLVNRLPFYLAKQSSLAIGVFCFMEKGSSRSLSSFIYRWFQPKWFGLFLLLEIHDIVYKHRNFGTLISIYMLQIYEGNYAIIFWSSCACNLDDQIWKRSFHERSLLNYYIIINFWKNYKNQSFSRDLTLLTNVASHEIISLRS